MDDLRQRFATLDRIPVPDLRTDVERRRAIIGMKAPTGRVIPKQPAWAVAGPFSSSANRFRRSPILLLVAVLATALLVGGTIAVGSGLLHLPSVVPPAPSPDASRFDSPRPTSTDATVIGSGSWTLTGKMKYGRHRESATLLPDGHVLVAGGGPSGSTSPASAELYDPSSGRWTETGSLYAPRVQGHSATLLPDGKVLVAGGDKDGLGHPPQPSAELYDPDTGTWTKTGSMLVARSHHSATLLPDGKVLVAGGTVYSSSGEIRASEKAELYDPVTGTWTTTGSMLLGRAAPTAALLPDGTVLVVGGSDRATPVLQSAELYDPSVGTWAPAPSFAGAGACRIAASLLDGNVLVVCAEAGGARTSAELYHPAPGSWVTTEGPPKACCVGEASPQGSIIRLADGRVLWKDLVDAGELYNPASGTWVTAGGPTYPADPSWGLPYTSTDEGAGYYADTLTLLPDGRVLMTTLGAGLLYDPNGGR